MCSHGARGTKNRAVENASGTHKWNCKIDSGHLRLGQNGSNDSQILNLILYAYIEEMEMFFYFNALEEAMKLLWN